MTSNAPAPLLVLAGRAAFAAIFLFAATGHFSPETIAFAEQAGVPLASIAVPLSGVLALIGGLSVLLGYRARVGAWLLILFMVPVTVSMHAFWSVDDPMARRMEMVMFMKNLAIVGGAVFIAHFGAGPLSLDQRAGRT
jgi:putative oxidoreductase